MDITKKIGQRLGEEKVDEAMKIAPQAFKQLAKLTDNNDHNRAVMEGFKLFKNKKMAKATQGLMDMHDAFGHMPQEMLKVRDMMYQILFDEAKKKLSPEDFKKFNSSF